MEPFQDREVWIRFRFFSNTWSRKNRGSRSGSVLSSEDGSGSWSGQYQTGYKTLIMILTLMLLSISLFCCFGWHETDWNHFLFPDTMVPAHHTTRQSIQQTICRQCCCAMGGGTPAKGLLLLKVKLFVSNFDYDEYENLGITIIMLNIKS